jgi:hypothetical protein
MIEQVNEPDPIEIIEPIVEKPSRGERLKRSVFARLRRKEVKQIKSVHQEKLEKEAEKKLKNA